MRFLFAIFLLSAGAAWGQLSAPVLDSAPAMYEGQKVGSIDIATQPQINTDALRSRLRQKVDEPYSRTRVQQSMDDLKQMQRFNKVQLRVEPAPNGLKLTFVLEPAFYMGLIHFPGGLKLFRYTRLLQVADLPNDQPYQPSQIKKAADALATFLNRNGFFEASVRPEVDYDQAHQLANVTFHMVLNQRAKVGQINFLGPRPEESAKLARALHSWGARVRGDTLKPGKKYTLERIQGAEKYLRSYLTGEHRLIKRLRLQHVQYHPDTRRADLFFEAGLGPPVSVRLTGARLTRIPWLQGRSMRTMIPIFDEGSVDPELIQEGRQNLVNFFQKKGYFDVRVQSQVEEKPDRVNVVFQVNKGKKHKVAEIAVHGNTHFSTSELLSHVTVKKGHLFSSGQYSDKLLKQSANAIAAVYRNDGYQEVKVAPRVVDREPKIYVAFDVTEGEQTMVEALHVQGNQGMSLNQIEPKPSFHLAPGQPFSPARLSQDRDQVLAKYLDNGYARAEFRSSVQPVGGDKHRVEVTYNINEGPQVRVSELVLLGAKHTNPGYIRRSVNIHPEQPLSQTALLASESRLYDDGVFDWVAVDPRKPITSQTEEQAVVKVHEAKRNEITYGFGFEIARRGGSVPSGTIAVPGLPVVGVGKNVNFSSSEKTFISPRGSIEYIRRNMRGLGETLSASALIARLDQKGLITYQDPHLRTTNWQSMFSVSAERSTENPIYTARLGDASFQIQRYLDRQRTQTLQLRYDFNKTSLTNLLVPDLVLPEDRSVRLSTVSGTYIQDTRDKPLDAHRGTYQTIDFGITPTALGSSADFIRFLGRRSIYVPVKGMVWANRVQLGLAAPFAGSRVPASERFFSGGGNSLRGFPINGAGPQRPVTVCSNPADKSTCSSISVPVGGLQLFIVNSELRFPLPVMKNLGGVVFYDGGNVYQHIQLSNLIDNYTHTVGFGIRYNTPIGPVRVDIGHLLEPVQGLRATQFFVTIGQAF